MARRYVPLVSRPARPPSLLELPWELLQIIFCYFVLRVGISRHRLRTLLCGADLDLIPIPHLALRRDTIRAVCQHWREAAQLNTQLWQDIEVAPQMNLAMLGQVVARSGSRPLRIHCYYTLPGHGPGRTTSSRKHSESASDTILQSSSAHISAAFKTLTASRQRWQSLTLYTNHHLLVNSCLQAMYSVQPAGTDVQSFHVVFTGELDLSASLPRHLHFPVPAPMTVGVLAPLTSLSVCGCRVDWGLLAALGASSLRILRLTHILNSIPLADFLDILAAASGLEELKIAGAFLKIHTAIVPARLPPADRVVLGGLRCLCLAGLYVPTTSHLLLALDLPGLRELWLDLPYQRMQDIPCDFTDVIAILIDTDAAIPLSSLQVLSVRALGCRNPAHKDGTMMAFFAALHEVTDVFLDFGCLEVAFWRWLVEACGQGYLPALKSLTVSRMSVIDVQELIHMRGQAAHGPLHIHMLLPGDARELRYPRKWLTWLRGHVASFDAIDAGEVQEYLAVSIT